MTRGKKAPVMVHLLDKIRFDTESGCWLWTASLNRGGYASFSSGGYGLGHRAAYELFIGPIPDGLHVDHLCHVRHCVNPDHLEAVTQAENNRRMWARTTHCPKGHPKTEANTMVRKSGTRECAECNRDRARKVAEGRRECHGDTFDCKRSSRCTEGRRG